MGGKRSGAEEEEKEEDREEEEAVKLVKPKKNGLVRGARERKKEKARSSYSLTCSPILTEGKVWNERKEGRREEGRERKKKGAIGVP